jgi:hypothetical protein
MTRGGDLDSEVRKTCNSGYESINNRSCEATNGVHS